MCSLCMIFRTVRSKFQHLNMCLQRGLLHGLSNTS
ncbi:hypothetical protein LINGRAHAP2_LOCUS14414 [Linum grandiflorum]